MEEKTAKMAETRVNEAVARAGKTLHYEKDGKETKLVFKDNVCRADEFGRPITYWDPKKKERYVLRVAAKGQECRILRELKRGFVEVEFYACVPMPNGNTQVTHKKEKIQREMLEEVEV